jgi:hypothetical protein
MDSPYLQKGFEMEIIFAIFSGLILGWFLGADWERSKRLKETLRKLMDNQPLYEWEIKEEKEVKE